MSRGGCQVKKEKIKVTTKKANRKIHFQICLFAFFDTLRMSGGKRLRMKGTKGEILRSDCIRTQNDRAEIDVDA
jgi:hypothetical protein